MDSRVGERYFGSISQGHHSTTPPRLRFHILARPLLRRLRRFTQSETIGENDRAGCGFAMVIEECAIFPNVGGSELAAGCRIACHVEVLPAHNPSRVPYDAPTTIARANTKR